MSNDISDGWPRGGSLVVALLRQLCPALFGGFSGAPDRNRSTGCPARTPALTSGGASLPAVAVEGQPLTANIERLDQALQKHIDRGDGEEVLLPLTMFYGPGPEYRWLKRSDSQ